MKSIHLFPILFFGFAACVSAPRAFTKTEGPRTPATQSLPSAYDNLILSDHPLLFLSLGHRGASTGTPIGISEAEMDLTNSGHNGKYLPAASLPRVTAMPNGDTATHSRADNRAHAADVRKSLLSTCAFL